MLVLSRKPEEAIEITIPVTGASGDPAAVIGEIKVKITVLSLNHKKCRLGIEAPAIVQVLRAELSQRQGARLCPP